jgi:hypothetical protein
MHTHTHAQTYRVQLSLVQPSAAISGLAISMGSDNAFPVVIENTPPKTTLGFPKDTNEDPEENTKRQSIAIAQLPESALRPLRHVFAQSAYRSGIAARSEIGSFGFRKLTPPPPPPPLP